MNFLRRTTNATGSCSANTELDIFANLSTKEVAAADRFLNTLEVRAGKTLTNEGDTTRDFGVVISGQVGVSIDGEAVGVLDDGSQFGSVGLLSAGPAEATFTALGPCTLAVCGRREFASLRKAAPELARRIDERTARSEQYLASRKVTATIEPNPALGGHPGHMLNWEFAV